MYIHATLLVEVHKKLGVLLWLESFGVIPEKTFELNINLSEIIHSHL